MNADSQMNVWGNSAVGGDPFLSFGGQKKKIVQCTKVFQLRIIVMFGCVLLQ